MTIIIHLHAGGVERGGAAGERVYKLTGKAFSIGQNGATPQFGTIFDRLTVYPSPYIVLTNEGYTKHYYAGTERIATVIGDGNLPMISKSLGKQHAAEIVDGFEKQTSGVASFNPERTQKNENIKLEPLDELQYKEGGLEEIHLFKEDSNNVNLTSLFKEWQAVREKNKDKEQQKDEDSEVTIFFTHSDHLGSASWITDRHGDPVQYMHYAPYGELLANQNWYGYDERFKFTGKERDAESGYDFFGARYYDHRKGFWNSVDPLVDKNIINTPYLYCGGNPVMFIDPDGMDEEQREIAIAKATEYVSKNPGKTYKLGERNAPGGLVDCSGMIRNCILAAGEEDPVGKGNGNGVKQIAENSERIESSLVEPGNLVTFDTDQPAGRFSHIGIITSISYDENGQLNGGEFIHSGSSNGPTKCSLMNEYWKPRITGFYKWDTHPDIDMYNGGVIPDVSVSAPAPIVCTISPLKVSQIK